MKPKFFYTLFTILLLAGCYREDDYAFRNIDVKALFTITAQTQTVLADEFSTIKITVAFPEEVDTAISKVTFTTTAGSFTNSMQTVSVTPSFNVDSNRMIAVAYLRSAQKKGEAKVTANAAGFSKELIIVFTQSFPDKITLTASRLNIQPANGQKGEVIFIGELFKTTGTTSIGSVVDVHVFDSSYKREIGFFKDYKNLSDSSGNTFFTYVLGDSTANGFYYYGKLHAIATTENQLRDTVSFFSTK